MRKRLGVGALMVWLAVVANAAAATVVTSLRRRDRRARRRAAPRALTLRSELEKPPRRLGAGRRPACPPVGSGDARDERAPLDDGPGTFDYVAGKRFGRGVNFLQTEEADVLPARGQFSLRIVSTDAVAVVTVRRGQAKVRSGEGAVVVRAGQRTVVVEGKAPTKPR